MDAISYSYADKAQKRIKKFIENPDSTSGVLTVPKTIAAGETITIPTGRVAILPDLQVDGDLVVNGDLFIPTGSMTSQVVQKVTSTDNAVVRFNGTTGDVQNSGVTIDDNNNVGIGVPTSDWNTSITAINFGYSGNIYSRKSGDGTHFGSNYYSDNADGIGARYKNNYYATSYRQGDGIHRWSTAPLGTAGNAITWTNAMTLSSNGNLLLGTTTDNGVGKLQVNGIASASKFMSNRLNISTVAGTWVNISTLGSGLHIITQSDYNASAYGACMIVLVAEGTAFIVSNTGPAIFLRMSGVTAQINFPITMSVGINITTLN